MSVECLMSEQGEPNAEASVVGGQHGQSAGSMLRQAREAAGVDIAALAFSLKVPVKMLEALEGDQWSLLPDLAFTRALAASVCRTFKLDPVPVLERLPALTQKLILPNGSGLNTPFRGASGSGRAAATLRHLSRPLVLSVIALLLGAVALILVPSVAPLSFKLSSVTPDVAVTPASRVPAMPTGPAEVAGEVQAPLPSAATSAPEVAVPAATASLAGPQSTLTSDVQTPPSGESVVFKTIGPSWVEVSDARGVTVLRKLMQAGESASVSGAMPLSVLVGKADVTRVEVRGKLFDLTSISRDNVARFEVK